MYKAEIKKNDTIMSKGLIQGIQYIKNSILKMYLCSIFEHFDIFCSEAQRKDFLLQKFAIIKWKKIPSLIENICFQ
jgi:hypothetical protein